MEKLTVHDLAADWWWVYEARTFRLRGGRVDWQQADYVGDRLRISRVVSDDLGLRALYRFVDPDTRVTLADLGERPGE